MIYQEETQAWVLFIGKLFSAQAQENKACTSSISIIYGVLAVWHNQQRKREKSLNWDSNPRWPELLVPKVERWTLGEPPIQNQKLE